MKFMNIGPKYRAPEGGEGGGSGGDAGGGEGGGEGGDGPSIEEQVNAAVEKATAGLKATNQALKEEKTKIREQLDAASGSLQKLGGDEGIAALLKMKENLEKDEVGKLLAEGKHDEWFEKRTASMRRDHENQFNGLQVKLDEQVEQNNLLQGQLRSTVLKAEVLSAAKDAEVLAEAVPDIQLRAERAFEFDAEREMLVMKDEEGGVLFGKDGKTPKSVAEWLDEQKEAARHWWPASKGGGAGGSGEPGGGGGSSDMGKLEFGDFRERRMKQKQKRRAF
jgi:hypothetical protein